MVDTTRPRPKVLEWYLAEVSRTIGEKPYERGCPASIGRIVALLHNRTKTNVIKKKALRALTEEDADFAIQALGVPYRHHSTMPRVIQK